MTTVTRCWNVYDNGKWVDSLYLPVGFTKEQVTKRAVLNYGEGVDVIMLKPIDMRD